MGSRESGGSTGACGANESDGSSGRLSKPWYRSGIGLAVVGADVLVTVALVSVTTEPFVSGLPETSGGAVGVVPWYIYVFSVLGAFGYVFTALTDDFHCETAKVLRVNFRVPAALPLGAGIFLLSDVVLAEATGVESVVAGLAFLAGLYVNLAYRRFGALAERLLPDRGDDADGAIGGDSVGRGEDGAERSIEYDERDDAPAATAGGDGGRGPDGATDGRTDPAETG